MADLSYKRNMFFSRLAELEKTILEVGYTTDDNGTTLHFTDYTKDSLGVFLKFIREGSYTTSEAYKFIVRNFELSNSDLINIWNSISPKPKTEATLRVQKRDVATLLTSMFGDVYDITYAFLSNDEKAISNIINRVQVFSVKDVRFADVIMMELSSYALTRAQIKYNLTDCIPELKALCLFSKRNIEEHLKALDKDKLSYIFQLLKEPIISKQGVVNEDKAKLNSLFLSGLNASNVDLIISSSDFVKQSIELSNSSADTSIDFRVLYEKICAELEALKADYTNSLGDDSFNVDVELGCVSVSQDFYALLSESTEYAVGNQPTATQLTEVLRFIASMDKEYIKHQISKLDADTISLVLGIIASDDSDNDKRENVLGYLKSIKEELISK